ncbi:MAG: SagB/ThcOx family dehydrogenase, partial [Candidatus Eisenbacteria bacterium]|nr:SagB/ThcOx family dehydrogenase [Candidatus Eisenbacteria bacterium]
MKGPILGILCGLVMILAAACAQEPADISLPSPRTSGGMPLRDALAQRQSTRSFSPAELSPQTLSDLLWAAAGINRPDAGKRTAPSARNWQEVSVYVVTAQGAYRYDAQANLLRAEVAADLRAATGKQSFVG